MRPNRTLAFTSAAMIGFAANSLLCRAALASHAIDAGTFTLVRLASGAVMLAAILRASRGERAAEGAGFASASALFAYAILFSFAYLRLATGTGALILFGAVQLTMILGGVRSGERPRAAAWAGIVVALGGLVVLVFPGLHAPDPLGAISMAGAGVAWGIYSLRGRGTKNPLAVTAKNFAIATPLAGLVFLVTAEAGAVHASLRGVSLAVASGAIASGVGYSLWYAALRGLTATRAAVVQLSVPVLAAASGVALLGEAPSLRLALAGAAVLGGVGLVLRSR